MEAQVESSSPSDAPPPQPVDGEAVQAPRCAWHAIVRSGDKSIQFQGAPSVTAHVQHGVVSEDFLWGLKTIGAPACLSRVRHHHTVAQNRINKRRVVIAGGKRVLELLFTADPPSHLIYALEDVFSRHELPGTKLASLQARAAGLHTNQDVRTSRKEVRLEVWRQQSEETRMKRREKALRRATALARVAKKFLG